MVGSHVYCIFLPRKCPSTSLGHVPHFTQSLGIARGTQTHQVCLTSRSCALCSCLLPSPQLHGRKGRCYLKPPREEAWISIIPHKSGLETDSFGSSSLCEYVCFWGCRGVTHKNNQEKKSGKVTTIWRIGGYVKNYVNFLKVWMLYHAYLISQGWLNSTWIDADNVYELRILPNDSFLSELKHVNLVFPKDVIQGLLVSWKNMWASLQHLKSYIRSLLSSWGMLLYWGENPRLMFKLKVFAIAVGWTAWNNLFLISADFLIL